MLRDDLGSPPSLAYGSMLGAVRSGHLIGHDMDIDLAYLSAATTPVDAMLESFAIERHLRDKGWSLRRQNGGFLQALLRAARWRWRNIDIFTMFVDLGVARLYGITTSAHPDVDSTRFFRWATDRPRRPSASPLPTAGGAAGGRLRSLLAGAGPQLQYGMPPGQATDEGTGSAGSARP